MAMRSTTLKPADPHASRSTFYSASTSGGVLTIKPAGPSLTEREAIVISCDVKPIMDRCAGSMRALVLDLSQVRIMSSFGLGMCIELRNAARAVNANTIVFGLSDELTELFKMLKVDRLYTMARNVKELAKAIGP